MATPSADELRSALNAVERYGGIRQASRATGISYHILRERSALARASASVGRKQGSPAGDVASFADALSALAETQRQQTALLGRLLGGDVPPVKKGRAAKQEIGADEKPVAGGTLEPPEHREVQAAGRRFFITAAQNNSHVHDGLLAAAKQWCRYNGGEIKVARLAYNSKSYGQPKAILPDGDDLWYAPELAEYMVRDPLRLAPDLIFCSDIPISPTAVDPLSGLESYTKASSGIFAHTKHEMRSMASMKGTPARMLYTTGCITQANYVPLKTGKKAEHHHVYGGLVVEIDADGTWFVRQINATADGSFYDLDRLYTPDGSMPATSEGLTFGDIHRRKLTEGGIIEAIWGPGGMVDTLRVRKQFIEDLNDFAPRNHHNIGSPYFLAVQRTNGQESVEAEIQECADFLRLASRPWSEVLVVDSNHDQAFIKWLEYGNGHTDLPNARYWHAWNARVFASIERGEKPFPFEDAIREKAPDLDGVRFLREDESYIICPDYGGGIECSLHGHRGPNGSRGTTRGFRVLGIRTTTAHSHAAGIWGGQYSAGVTGDFDMCYNQGPSSWSHSHVLTYPNSKRAVITMRGTRWRAAPLTKPRIRVQAIGVSA